MLEAVDEEQHAPSGRRCANSDEAISPSAPSRTASRPAAAAIAGRSVFSPGASWAGTNQIPSGKAAALSPPSTKRCATRSAVVLADPAGTEEAEHAALRLGEQAADRHQHLLPPTNGVEGTGRLCLSNGDGGADASAAPGR